MHLGFSPEERGGWDGCGAARWQGRAPSGDAGSQLREWGLQGSRWDGSATAPPHPDTCLLYNFWGCAPGDTTSIMLVPLKLPPTAQASLFSFNPGYLVMGRHLYLEVPQEPQTQAVPK